jgi:hypothetical protein
VVFEHIRRFDDVVIHADEDHVVLVHGRGPFPIGIQYACTVMLPESI